MLALAVYCDVTIFARVRGLLPLCRPAAVGWLIVSFVIGVAVQAMLGTRTRSHIFAKRAIAILPPITDLDATATVSRIGGVRGFATSAAHVNPNLIGGIGGAAMPQAAFCILSTRPPAQAATTPCVAIAKKAAINNFLYPASTTTPPESRTRRMA